MDYKGMISNANINIGQDFGQDLMSTNLFRLPQFHCISNKRRIMAVSIKKRCCVLLKVPSGITSLHPTWN